MIRVSKDGPHLSRVDLAAAQRVLKVIDGMADPFTPPVDDRHFPSQSLAKFAHALRSARDDRGEVFDDSLFSDIVWDILLVLYIASSEGYRLNVSSIPKEVRAPQTTTLRWIDHLVGQGICRREKHKLDGRVYWLDLTELGHRKMTALLEKMEARLRPE